METEIKRRSGVRDYSESIVPVDHVEPVPRRIRGIPNGVTVFDATRATTVDVFLDGDLLERPHTHLSSSLKEAQ